MASLSLAGWGVVVWGYALANTSTSSSTTTGSGCVDYPAPDISPVMVPWLVLVVLALIGAAIWRSVRMQAGRRREPMNPVITTVALLGITAAVVLFPGWWVLVVGLNCSL